MSFADLDLAAIKAAAKRTQIIGEALLIEGDCRDILPLLSGLAAIVCDPAYKLTAGGKGKSARGMTGGWIGDYDNKGSPVVVNCPWPSLTPLLFSALAQNADCYLMANDKNLQACLNALTLAGFQIHNILVWDKRTATANRWYMKNCEFVVYAWKGKAKMINAPGSKQLISMPQIDETEHPTEKPVPLMMHFISNSSAPGGLICDPQMGTGTTGVAAIQLSRRFVGIELSPKWFDAACQRLDRAAPHRDFYESAPAQELQSGFAL